MASRQGTSVARAFNRIYREAKARKTVLLVLSCFVVFITTYMLILPAVTLDQEEAERQGGIDVPAQMEQAEQIEQTEVTTNDNSEVAPEQAREDEATRVEQDGAAVDEENETESSAPEQPYVLSYDGKGFAVTADTSESGLPEGTQLFAEEISKDDASFEELYQEALKAYQKESKSKTEAFAFAKFYDISMLLDGEPIEPDNAVDVTISYEKAQNVSDADTLRIIHFGEKKTEIIDPDEVVVDPKKGRLQETSFTAESFSVYGVITVPAPQGADDLDGRTFKISRGTRYLMTETGDIGNGGDGATGFLKGGESEAPVWQLEQVNGSVYYISTMVGDQKKYMYMKAHDSTNRADASLSDSPQEFTVSTAQGGYRLSVRIGNTTYYLDEHNDTGGNGFAGWGGQTGNGVLTFHFTQPTTENNKEYMVVVKQGDAYYIVQNDGTLTPAEYNQQDNTVAVEDPMMWKYDGNRLYHVTREAGFTGDDIASDSYYRYIDPNKTSGLNEDNESNTNRTVNGLEVHINTRDLWNRVRFKYTSDHKLQSVSNDAYYIGVSGESQLQLRGQVSEEEAVEVFLADPLVSESNWTKHTVNHIDISINGTAEVDIPLAYGKYYDAEGNVVKEVPQNKFEKLHLTSAQVVDTSDLSITPADMKRAHISASCNGQSLDNAFYVTGYSGNAEHSGQTGEQTEYATSPQVRIEGSFLVANMPQKHATIDTNRYDTDQTYRNDIRNEHLENKVEYSVSVVKEIQFYLQMPVLDEEGNPVTDGQGKPVYQQLYDADGKPLTIRADVSFSDSFNYWDEDNECPVFTDRDKWYYYQNYRPNPNNNWNTDNWGGGDIARCNFSGMDFKLGGSESQAGTRVYAIEITKIVVDENGNRIKSDDIGTTKFNIYRKQVDTIPLAIDPAGVQYHDVVAPTADEVKDLNVGSFSDDPYATDSDYQLLREKNVQVGSDGFGLVYDYNVDPALYYVEEDPDSVAESITDNTGKKWNYKQSYVWTEYAWRNCSNDNLMHTGQTYDEPPEQGGYKGVPEILGNHYGYNETDGPYTNDFLEFYVYNVYESPKVDVPVKKTWPDFDGADKENYDWTATFKLQWAPLYPGEETPTDNFTDVTPEKTITITKNQMKDAESQEASLADRTFKDLPKYGTDQNGNTFRYQYSLEETAYQVIDKTTGVILYSWSETEGYNTDDEDTHYQPFYPHDAGETVSGNTDEQNEADANYYIQVRNAKRNIRERETIDVSLEKQWNMDDDDTLDDRDDGYYAEFELRRFVHTEYRDISHMSDSDRTADPVTVTIKDGEGNEIDSLQVQPNVGVYLAGNFKPHDDAKSVTFTTETPVRMPNGSHATSITATAAGSNQSNALVRSGEFFVTHDTVFTIESGSENLIEDGKKARVLDTSSGTSPLPDSSFSRTIRLDSTNEWKIDLENLIRSETSAGDDDDNENVTYYEYYFVEKESNPGGFARYFRAGENGVLTEVLSGDSDHQIEEDDHIVAMNGPTNRLVVKKKWRGTPDTTGFPGVTFTLYQSTDLNGNDKRIFTDKDFTEYKNIELKGNSLEWVCPVDLPATYIDNNGTSRKYYYFVQEDEQSGNYENGEGQNMIRVGWEFYYYLSSCLDENGEEKTKQTNAYNQPYQAAIEGGDIQRNGGTITICNRLNRYTDLDIKKQFFTLLESGSWDNSTSAMTSNVVLGFKVIRAIKLPDGSYLDERGNESAKPVWMDFSEEMLCGYDANGNPVLDNSGNDFYLKYFGLWHFEIMNNWGDQTNVNAADSGSSMPTYGFYIKNGEDVVVEYEYSFRETNVYKDLDRTPYPEWDWFSSVTPVNGYGPGKTPFEAFPKVFHGQDPERIANFQASDLIIHKQWIGDITADEVYVKLWRTDGSGAPEDFTAVIAEDVRNNHNWQMYVDDESCIDTRHGWLILKSDENGNWTDTLKVNRALLVSVK